MNAPSAVKQVRKSADDRVVDLLDAADALIRRTRSAELSLHDLAEGLGISRALVYAYFPDRYRLLDAVCARHVEQLEQAGLSTCASKGSLSDRAEGCARILLAHALAHGATLELIMRERDVVRQLDGRAARYLRRTVATLARQAAAELRMGRREAMALVELLSVIPLEAARRVEADNVRPEIAQAVSLRLIRSSIAAQVPTGSA